MPLELQVIRASEFVRLNADALLDFEQSKTALRQLAYACRKRGLTRALLDVRSVPVPSKPQFTITQLAALVATFREAGFGKEDRLGVLYLSDVYGGIRKFAFLGRLGGLQVQAFTEFERALEWLSEGNESPAEGRLTAVPIPIKRPAGRSRTRALVLRAKGNSR
ncbi:MAG: hypothetical protein C5B50_19040 [Verrucomicrobia bacterium]|nr:MAG: hypothetical protein C5B50_19040 [Verrucomicrobiota bacterium]